MQAEEQLMLGLGHGPRGLVFTRADGEPLDAESLTKAFRTPHCRERSDADHISRSQAYPHQPPAHGRHSRQSRERAITLSVYAAYIPSMQADAALRVDA